MENFIKLDCMRSNQIRGSGSQLRSQLRWVWNEPIKRSSQQLPLLNKYAGNISYTQIETQIISFMSTNFPPNAKRTIQLSQFQINTRDSQNSRRKGNHDNGTWRTGISDPKSCWFRKKLSPIYSSIMLHVKTCKSSTFM